MVRQLRGWAAAGWLLACISSAQLSGLWVVAAGCCLTITALLITRQLPTEETS